MSVQNILEKPTVNNFDSDDKLFINHNDTLRQIPLEDTGFATEQDIQDLETSKQDVLTFDNVPTANSNNPVKSGGVKTALDQKQNTLTFDNTPTENSNNPVKSGGVYTALETQKEDIEKGIDETLEEYAKIDGYYESLGSGTADQLSSNIFEEDSEPYNFRTSGGSIDIGNREVDKLVGGTVAWNQLVQNGNFESTSGWSSYRNTLVASGNIATATIANEETLTSANINHSFAVQSGHKYVLAYSINSSESGNTGYYVNDGGVKVLKPISAGVWTQISTVRSATSISSTLYLYLPEVANVVVQIKNVMAVDLTAMFGSTIADYIYSLETSNAGAGVAWFKKLFPKPYYAYNAGELMSVQASSHDMVGFNAFDGEVDLGGCWTETGTYQVIGGGYMGSPNKIKCLPNTTYCFTASNITAQGFLYYAAFDANGDYISRPYGTEIPADTKYGTFTTPSDCYFIGWYLWRSIAFTNAEAEDICVNLSWDGERDGEYEPYVKHSYPLDSDLVLRGVPKLDSSNNLYYDGDTYESDGSVTRKYGIVDLGTLNWSYYSDYQMFYTPIVGKKAGTGNLLCSKYRTTDAIFTVSNDKSVGGNGSNGTTYIRDSAYTDAADLKTSLNGVYLVYELATPTTETADTFVNPQIVDDFGTEEYITTSIVPVGHYTQYMANLKAKLEMSPDSPNGAGDYIVRQTDGENEYVSLASNATIQDMLARIEALEEATGGGE